MISPLREIGTYEPHRGAKLLPILTETRRHWIVAAGTPTTTGREFFVINGHNNALVAAALTRDDAEMIASVFNTVQDAIHALHIAGNVIDGLLRGHHTGTAELVYTRFVAQLIGTELDEATT